MDLEVNILFGSMFLCVFLENVALNKPAWQQDAIFNSMANRAVDGRKTKLYFYGGECANSDFKSTTEWRVDLKGILSIHHILIQFATDNKNWGTIYLLQ